MPAQVAVRVEKQSSSYKVHVSVEHVAGDSSDELSMIWCAPHASQRTLRPCICQHACQPRSILHGCMYTTSAPVLLQHLLVY